MKLPQKPSTASLKRFLGPKRLKYLGHCEVEESDRFGYRLIAMECTWGYVEQHGGSISVHLTIEQDREGKYPPEEVKGAYEQAADWVDTLEFDPKEAAEYCEINRFPEEDIYEQLNAKPVE